MESMIDHLDGNKKLILHLGGLRSHGFELVAAVVSFSTEYLTGLRHGDGRYCYQITSKRTSSTL
jgi:hypothetical protein